MIDQIRNPPVGFEILTKEYFKLKGIEIINDLDLWIIRARKTCSSYCGLADCLIKSDVDGWSHHILLMLMK